MIKLHNAIISTVVNVRKASIFTENNQHIQKLTDIRFAIKTKIDGDKHALTIFAFLVECSKFKWYGFDRVNFS